MMISSDGVGGVTQSYSSFVPSPEIHKMTAISIRCVTMPEFLAQRIRIQNLRFAYLLCAAQEMSTALNK
jgi:hypothetical protein